MKRQYSWQKIEQITDICQYRWRHISLNVNISATIYRIKTYDPSLECKFNVENDYEEIINFHFFIYKSLTFKYFKNAYPSDNDVIIRHDW